MLIDKINEETQLQTTVIPPPGKGRGDVIATAIKQAGIHYAYLHILSAFWGKIQVAFPCVLISILRCVTTARPLHSIYSPVVFIIISSNGGYENK